MDQYPTGRWWAARGLDSDASAALEAAALEDSAAGPGGHAGEKPVYALAAAFLWLVSSLHNLGILRYLGGLVN